MCLSLGGSSFAIFSMISSNLPFPLCEKLLLIVKWLNLIINGSQICMGGFHSTTKKPVSTVWAFLPNTLIEWALLWAAAETLESSLAQTFYTSERVVVGMLSGHCFFSLCLGSSFLSAGELHLAITLGGLLPLNWITVQKMSWEKL